MNKCCILLQNTSEEFQKKILKERIARLSGSIALLQVGAQTVVELKDKQLRVEDAVNATKVAAEFCLSADIEPYQVHSFM